MILHTLYPYKQQNTNITYMLKRNTKPPHSRLFTVILKHYTKQNKT